MQTGEYSKRMGDIEELVRKAESIPDPDSRAAALELARAVMELHGAGLAKIIEILSEGGSSTIDSLVREDLISSLLVLHDLHPDNLETRVTQALDSVLPYLRSHGGDLEFLGIQEGTVRLRFQGSCRNCPGSAITAREVIENAIYGKAPDAAGVEIEGIAPRTAPADENLVQLEPGDGFPLTRVGRDGL